MSGGREWAMSLSVRCRVETCTATDSACVAAVSAHDATEGAKKVLRYRGWKIDRRDDLCPEHAGPIRVCEVCGEPTPPPYGSDSRHRHITGVDWACSACYRRMFDQELAARFIQAREGAS